MTPKKSIKRVLTGQVVSNKMDKTAVVEVTRRVAHPLYKKYVKVTKKFHAHDESNACNIGDEVVIESTRPLSRLKRWRILEITKTSAAEAGV